MLSDKRTINIDELNANRHRVSVHKYGFFLCLQGTARLLLGKEIYQISPNYLCIYTPNTFLQILEKSPDLSGVLEEDDVDAYYPVVSSIDIRERLQIRRSPCVQLSEQEVQSLLQLIQMIRESGGKEPQVSLSKTTGSFLEGYIRYLRYALCLKIMELYFCNKPVEALPQSREDRILNRFLMSVYQNCHRQRMVQYYADEQYLSPSYFSSIIKMRSGKSALEWIENVSMIFARQYLECPDMSFKEIAERMNFPDQSAFGRYFKHHEGCSPSEFRRKGFKQDKF